MYTHIYINTLAHANAHAHIHTRTYIYVHTSLLLYANLFEMPGQSNVFYVNKFVVSHTCFHTKKCRPVLLFLVLQRLCLALL